MSLDWNISSNPLKRRLRDLTAAERKEEAYTFIKLFYHEHPETTKIPFGERWSEIASQLSKENYYDHTYDELVFGAKVAWRNHAKCIGRLYWNSLIVNDYRHISEPNKIAECLQSHLQDGFNGGKIKSIISIFSPVKGDKLPPYIENNQLLQYAGYLDILNHRIVGDKQNVAFTKMLTSMGWAAPDPQGNFDILPLCIRASSGKRTLYSLDVIPEMEVSISHPHYAAIANLNLKWYALPVVSNMILTIGGIDYPCAPFNGFFMGTEIASRDLCDQNRYDMLADIATAIGLEHLSDNSNLWKDKAITEINHAVLFSFKQAGVSIVDHHEASMQFMEFLGNEGACHRSLSGDWTWITPPNASSTCPVFHLPMQDLHAVPNFYHSKLSDGAKLAPYYGDDFLTKFEIRLITWRKKIRNKLKSLHYRYQNSYRFWI